MLSGDALPLVTLPPLTPIQLARYQRQMILPELGLPGQRRLMASRVLVIGAGALGSAAATYLALAGVGTLGIADGDVVDLSNLHRQILHAAADVGQPKTTVARARLEALNPEIRVVEHPTYVTAANALDLFRHYDLVVNGSDNFPTRYLVNDAAVLTGLPLVDAAILRFEGQLTVFQPGAGCYRCLFPEPPPPGSVPSCAEAGVLGAVAGVLGSAEAVEALKLLTGVGQPLVGRFLLYDALTGEWQRLEWARNPHCRVCGQSPSITALVDYEAFCGTPGPDAAVSPAVEGLDLDAVAAERLIRAGRLQVLDVREPEEFAAGHIPQSLRDAREAAATTPILCVCAMGVRSRVQAEVLRAQGVEAYSLRDGLVAWNNIGGAWEGPSR